MAEARGRAEWDRTAAILALTANINRDPRRGRPLTPADFNPYAKHSPAKVIKADFSIFQLLVKKPEV